MQSSLGLFVTVDGEEVPMEVDPPAEKTAEQPSGLYLYTISGREGGTIFRDTHLFHS